MRPLAEDFPSPELAALLERASAAPFYRKRLLELGQGSAASKNHRSWRQLAVTTKADLRQAYPLGMLAVPMSEIASYHESTGTTGMPTSSVFTAEDWDDITSRFLRNAVGIGPGDMVLIKTPYALVTTAHQMHAAARRAGAAVVPADNRSRNMPYGKVVRLLRDLPITVAWCLPTEALIWARAAEASGLDPATDFPSLRAFLVAGETLSPARRKLISAAWGGKAVFQDYGSTETGSLAGDCAAGRLHFWADRVLAEVTDAQGREAERVGRGILTVTPLFRQAMPLVRYLTGDDVTLGDGCTCGRKEPVIEVHGRAGGELAIGSAALQPALIEQTVLEAAAPYGVYFWRARARGKNGEGGLEVEIAPTIRRKCGHAEAADEVAHALFTCHGVAAEVRSVEESTLLPPEVLVGDVPFRKPQYVFSSSDDWSRAVLY